MLQEAKWYIITSMTGNEEIVYKNLEDKIRAYKLNDLVQEIKLLKSREITIEVFDNKINPPPKNMRNTKTITWETLPGNKYKKTRIREINRFPGYIYLKMIMTPEVWYTIRNTFGVTGFVGSSGKGAQPIPMSDTEVQNLFDIEMNKDIIFNKSSISYVDNNVVEQKAKEVKIEFLSSGTNDEFYDSKNTSIIDGEELNNNIDELKELNAKENFIEENKYKKFNEVLKSEYNTKKNNEIIIDNGNVIDDKNIKFITEEKIDLDEKLNINKNPNACTINHDFKVGNLVKILSGEMHNEEGYIIGIDNDNSKIKVEMELFGRKMILDLNCCDIEKSK